MDLFARVERHFNDMASDVGVGEVICDLVKWVQNLGGRKALMEFAREAELLERIPAIGTRVRLRSNHDVGQIDVGFGEWGTVISSDEERVRVHLDRYHGLLDGWGNCLIVGLDQWDEQPLLYDDPEACTHFFSHLNNTLTGDRVCTTCGAQGCFDGDPNYQERWDAVDAACTRLGPEPSEETVRLWIVLDRYATPVLLTTDPPEGLWRCTDRRGDGRHVAFGWRPQ
jgi:hypothetical protein